MLYTIASVTAPLHETRSSGRSIVLATGFFDLFHAEHRSFLQKAKATGDILVVAVESDGRARKVKGEGRPVEPQSVRCRHVSGYADFCIALDDHFDNQEAYESLLMAVKPAFYAVSSHTGFMENKRMLVEKYGGKLVVVHPWNPDISTTRILESRKKQL